MGWAPYLHSGPNQIGLTAILILISLAVTPLLRFLLDNVPLNGEWCALTTWLSSFTLPRFFNLCCNPRRVETTGTPDTTRSQVRGVRHSFNTSLLVLLYLLWAPWSIISLGGEGCVTGMGDTGADYIWPAKQHVMEPRQVLEPHRDHFSFYRTKPSTQKRSFRRAQHRAQKHGYTFYRGRMHTAASLGTHVQESVTPRKISPNIGPTKTQRKQRLHLLNWNCGGLASTSWDYLQFWLMQQHFDVVMLQETHWAFSSEWVTDRYFVIHSGESRLGGLMTLISKQLCEQTDISWIDPIPGRLVHVRIHGKLRHIDLINVYQHVHVSNRMEQRSDLWHHLNSLLTSLNKKNTLIMMGDFNTSLTRNCSAVGTSTYVHNAAHSTGPKHSDSHLFLNLLTTYDLYATNTWSSNLGPSYVFEHQHSRIDFIICRRAFSDATSKQVQYVHDFPLLCPTGSHHVPMITSVLKVWHSSTKAQPFGWSRAQRLELCQHWQQPNARTWQLQQQVWEAMETLPEEGNRLDHVHKTLDRFTVHTPVRSNVPHYLTDLTPFKRFQVHSRALWEIRHATLPNLLQAWFHVTQRNRARQAMKISSSLARKKRLQKIYDVADQAARSKDHFRLYQAVRELAPKQRSIRVLLRSNHGELLTPSDEADWLRDWFEDLYHHPEHSPEATSFHWPFTVEEISHGLATLPLRKALSPEYSPSPFWRLTAQKIANYLDPFLHQCAQSCKLPFCWSQGTLCFLPKTSKRHQTPSTHRPIALLEPCGKAVMGACALRLLDEVGHILQRWPQFAYLPRRGTDDALFRLATHCRQVREVINQYKYPIHQRAQGSLPGDVGGGVIVSLDLSKAFDMVSRPQMMEGLQQLNISSELLQLLAGVYQQTTYQFWHKGEYRQFRTNRGIRQGCRVAPCLWAAYATTLLQAIAQPQAFNGC